VFYGVFGGGGVGLSYNAIISSVNRWFPGKIGMASGVLLLGFGIGGLALGSVVNQLAARIGIMPVFAILGVAMAAILFVLSFPLRTPSADEQVSLSAGNGDEQGVKAKPLSPVRDYTLPEMLKTPTFWIFFCWVTTASIGGLLVINSAANIAVFFGAPAVLGLIVSVFNGVGRPGIGLSYDRFGRSKAMLMTCGFLLTGGVILILGAVTGQAVFIFIGLPLIGISYGGAPALTSASAMGFFGPKNFPTNLATAMFALIPAAIIGPLVSSKLQESSGGEYLTTFIMLVGVGVLALLLTFILNAVSKKL
jgi:OFA family oxalate/formate antiporter-like MFS transporter